MSDTTQGTNGSTQFENELADVHAKNYGFLYRTARALTENHEDAEDAVHTAYLQFLQGRRMLRRRNLRRALT